MCFIEVSELWFKIRNEASLIIKKEPFLFDFYFKNVLEHKTLSSSLSYILSSKLCTSLVSLKNVQKLFNDVYCSNPSILKDVVRDIKCILKKDPVVVNYSTAFLYFKGFHALEAYRISHYLWNKKKYELSLYLQSRISHIFSVDIHPAANIGSSVMIDHATGIVIGSSVIIENDVVILQSVTLGSTGKNSDKNRHPIIRKGVVIGAGAKVLGNIEIGTGSKIGAGAVVLDTVPEHVTVVGVPAKIIKKSDDDSYFTGSKNNCFFNTYTFQYGDGI